MILVKRTVRRGSTSVLAEHYEGDGNEPRGHRFDDVVGVTLAGPRGPGFCTYTLNMSRDEAKHLMGMLTRMLDAPGREVNGKWETVAR